MNSNVYAILLAGGSGTRLWPLSRSLMPKHLLALTGEKTLLQHAAERVLKCIPPERIVTVTHESHLFDVKDQLRSIHPRLTKSILGEPQANNTLPAIAWGILEIAKRDPEATVGIFPSDQCVSKEDTFRHALEQAVQIARSGYLATFGIKPTGPETGFGYIQAGDPLDQGVAFRVKAFFEKPNRETATQYVKKGNFFWNSGMFVFAIPSFLEELKRLEPSLFEAAKKIVDSGNDPQLLKSLYPHMKKISIDYGILEKAKKVAVVPADVGWSDLGIWEAVYEKEDKDANQNVIQGDVLALDTQSSLLISKKGLLATIGLEDMTVIQTEDAVLVSRRDRVQEVKRIVERLKERKSPLAETHQTVSRPWGTYTVLEEGAGYKIKRIVVHPGQKLSLQRHKQRTEHWVVIEGTAKVANGASEKILRANESTFIAMGEKHRLENPGSTPLTIIEVQTGSYLGEDDIERFEDVYGRVK